MDFSKKIKNEWDIDYNMKTAATKYKDFLKGVLNEE